MDWRMCNLYCLEVAGDAVPSAARRNGVFAEGHSGNYLCDLCEDLCALCVKLAGWVWMRLRRIVQHNPAVVGDKLGGTLRSVRLPVLARA